jgi:hypothetical protein
MAKNTHPCNCCKSHDRSVTTDYMQLMSCNYNHDLSHAAMNQLTLILPLIPSLFGFSVISVTGIYQNRGR